MPRPVSLSTFSLPLVKCHTNSQDKYGPGFAHGSMSYIVIVLGSRYDDNLRCGFRGVSIHNLNGALNDAE